MPKVYTIYDENDDELGESYITRFGLDKFTNNNWVPTSATSIDYKQVGKLVAVSTGILTATYLLIKVIYR